MEIRRVGDTLLRSQRSPRTFLTPLISSRCPFTTQKTLNKPHKRQLQRSFTSSSRSAARFGSITTSAHPPAQPANSNASKPSTRLDWLTGSTTNRTSPISPSFPPKSSNNGPPSNPSSATEAERVMNRGNSANDLLASLNAARASTSSFLTANSTLPTAKVPRFEPVDMMRDVSLHLSNAPPPVRAPMRLTPITGRTVHLNQTMDVGRGLQLMETLVARNKVKATFNYQRFHERPGLKRKRLKSERWRRRFKKGFKDTIARVKQLKKQGW